MFYVTVLVVVVVVVAVAAASLRRRWHARRFVPFEPGTASALAVDCQTDGPHLTHHRGSSTPWSLRADTSTEIVLNGVLARHAILKGRTITCNHFDGDGLGAVFAAVDPSYASRMRPLLVACATLSDFREMVGDVAMEPTARAALAWSVWVNSVERARFWRPFGKMDSGSEARECADKYAYFLPRCRAALAEAAAVAAGGAASARGASSYDVLRRDAPAEFEAELARVYDDTAYLAVAGSVERHDALGLAIVTAPRPVHYYAAFGRTGGLDTVLTLMPGNRYELECKYTGYVQLASREVLPRLSLAPLAAALTAAERSSAGGGDEWVADRFTDSGPLLRLQRAGSGARLTRAQRFGSPYERDIAPSRIPPAAFVRAVTSYLEHGLRGPAARPRGTWTWTDLHDFNAAIEWGPWAAPAREKLAAAVAAAAGAGAEPA